MRTGTALAAAGALFAIVFLLAIPHWMHPPIGSQQIGYRAGSLVLFTPPAVIERANVVPASLPAAVAGPPATSAYKNVQVLTDVSAPEFMRLQQAITQWVAPTQGCGFCHVGNDYASDAKPTKIAARRMLQMVRHINADWQTHVSPAGVTCYTCHRGQPVPPNVWFPQPPQPAHGIFENGENWHQAAPTVRDFFPDAGFAEYLLENNPAVSQSSTALPTGQVSTAIVTKRIYEMMMQMSDGMGVNCGYCHNSRAFGSWEQSSPHRWQGFNGLELTRELNRNYLLPLAQLIPQGRETLDQPRQPITPARESGVQDGNALVVCATCHNWLPKPLNGANMVQDYPGLAPASLTRGASGAMPGTTPVTTTGSAAPAATPAPHG